MWYSGLLKKTSLCNVNTPTCFLILCRKAIRHLSPCSYKCMIYVIVSRLSCFLFKGRLIIILIATDKTVWKEKSDAGTNTTQSNQLCIDSNKNRLMLAMIYRVFFLLQRLHVADQYQNNECSCRRGPRA